MVKIHRTLTPAVPAVEPHIAELVHAGAFSVWLENGTAQSIVDEGANKASESDYASAKYVFEEYYKALESSDRKPHYEPATEEGTDTVPERIVLNVHVTQRTLAEVDEVLTGVKELLREMYHDGDL